MKPRIIRTEIGEGISTLVPYGVSADVSDFQRRLSARISRLRPDSVTGAGPTDKRGRRR